MQRAQLVHKRQPEHAGVLRSGVCKCAHLLIRFFKMYEWVHVRTWMQHIWVCALTGEVFIDCGFVDSLCKCVWISPSGMRLLHSSLCACWQKKSSYTTGCIMKSEKQLGNWSGYQSLPFCLCAFVWWPSKASIAILASHRIGLLYKNTPASSLQGWSGVKGVGAAGGEGGKHWIFVRNFPFASCSLSSVIPICLPSMSFFFFVPFSSKSE